MKESTKVGLALTFCFFVAWLDRMAINLTLPYLSKDLALDTPQMGYVLSSFFLGYAACQMLGGILADRYGPRPVILFSLVWWSVFTYLSGSAQSFESLVVTRFLFGMGEGLFPACVWKLISGWYPSKNRATANSIILSMIALGPALTPLVLGPLLPVMGWRSTFHLLGIMGGMCVLLAYRYLYSNIESYPRLPPSELQDYQLVKAQESRLSEVAIASTSFKDVFASPKVWVLFLNGLIMNIAMYGWLSWLPSYLMKTKNLDLKSTVVAASVPFFFGAVGCMIAGYVSDTFFRGKRRYLVVMSQLVGAVALYSFTQIQNPMSGMAAQSFAAFFLFMACGAIWSLPVVMLPVKLMGIGTGFINTGGQLGGFVTNILIGHLIAWRGGNMAAGFEVMLGALGLSTIIVAFCVKENSPQKYQTSDNLPSDLTLSPQKP
jgi:sugar phosphate permease